MRGIRKIYIIAFLLVVLMVLPGGVYAGNIEAQLPSSNGSDAFQVKDSVGAPLLHVGSDGYVGIGTTIPNWPLEVYGPKIDSPGECGLGFSSVGGRTQCLRVDINESLILDTQNFVGQWVPIVSFMRSGNVGIGTTNPGRNLHVVGNVRIDTLSNAPIELVQDVGGYGIGIYFQSRTSGGLTPAGRLQFTDNGNFALTSDNYAGYVGIGTTTPIYPLHMASGAYVTTGGVWTNASSREYKENIHDLTTEEAMAALGGL